MDINVRLTDEVVDLGLLFGEFSSGRFDMGGVCTFTGLVRDFTGDCAVDILRLEHYAKMADIRLRDICARAFSRWSLSRLWVTHRFGDLRAGDIIVVVMAGCVHRGASFEACRFVMDYLKVEAPFWKVEVSSSGERRVSVRDDDLLALRRWEV